jgi:hypothetical protein
LLSRSSLQIGLSFIIVRWQARGIITIKVTGIELMIRTLRAAKFLVVGPMIVGMLVVINLMTSPGHWWVQWPALGIGIAWVISAFRVLGALAMVGGLAALWAYLRKK